jgi:DNA-binding IscR family transcriptional regulator
LLRCVERRGGERADALTRDSESITVLDIVEAVAGPGQ